MENHHVGKIGPGCLQHAGGTVMAIELAVAFVGED
jgi:hypothetical protein